MKTFFLALMMALATFVPAMAADTGHSQGEAWLKPVEAQYVCMMNNKVFDKPQMAIQVEGKTYYGCCPMCKDMLEQDSEKRSAIDPVSGKKVDKATAVIGADTHGMTYYFESKENLDTFASRPMPEASNGTMMHDMGGMMMQHDQSDVKKSPAASAKSGEDHKQHH
ncbi:MAG TPA: hypothetical protein DEA55_01070 [Rhodospirillaceae bacterium]|nr:hypothetical protein [Rhodospirillaceae bacterium]